MQYHEKTRPFLCSRITLLAIITFTLATTGCWDSRDLNEKNIILAVIVGYMNGNYTFDVEQLNASEKTVDFTTLSSKGKTITEARNDLDSKTEQPIFLGAARVVLLTDAFAKSGIEEYANRLRQMRDYRKTILIVTTSTQPKVVLAAKPRNSSTVGFSIEEILTTLEVQGSAIRISLGELLTGITVGKIGLVVPQIDLNNGALGLVGYSVFKNMKKSGFIPVKKANGIRYMLSDYHPSTEYEIPYSKGQVVIKAILGKRKISPEIKNGRVFLTVAFNFTGEIQYSKRLHSLSVSDRMTIKKSLSEQIKKDIFEQIHLSQTVYKCDYLSFYRYFRAKHSDFFENNNWNRAYSQGQIYTKVDVVLRDSGINDTSPKRYKG